jgi:hypothetical protein
VFDSYIDNCVYCAAGYDLDTLSLYTQMGMVCYTVIFWPSVHSGTHYLQCSFFRMLIPRQSWGKCHIWQSGKSRTRKFGVFEHTSALNLNVNVTGGSNVQFSEPCHAYEHSVGIAQYTLVSYKQTLQHFLSSYLTLL